MATISDGATTIDVYHVLGHEVQAEANNVVHKILGRPDPDITLREASLRTGQLQLLCADVDAAYALFTMHRAAAVLQLVDAARPAASMQYVVAGGSVRLTVDQATQLRTIVEAPFQEVAL